MYWENVLMVLTVLGGCVVFGGYVLVMFTLLDGYERWQRMIGAGMLSVLALGVVFGIPALVGLT